MLQSLQTGSDFTNESFDVEIPANEDNTEPSDFVIPQRFNVIDDDINEVMQSFVLVAEIGADVPESLTCFQGALESFMPVTEVSDGCTRVRREEKGGETGCNANMEPTARFGATRIHINDNDGRCAHLYGFQHYSTSIAFCYLYQSCIIAAMIIGFTQRRRIVSEADGPFRQDLSFLITVDVGSMNVSDINYIVSFEAPASNMGRTANVGDNQALYYTFDHDALFGTFNATTGDLEDLRLLPSGSTILSNPLILTIVNDFNPEPEECFTIDIASPDVAGDRNIYECFDDDDNMDSFFCLHEICIVDDDGLFSNIHLRVFLK